LQTFLPDERTDPEKSARAAAQYLRYLHGRFGDWPLTLAAYNAGEGRVGRTLKRANARTFAEIADALPAETRMYVPKVLATIEVRAGVPPDALAGPRALAALIQPDPTQFCDGLLMRWSMLTSARFSDIGIQTSALGLVRSTPLLGKQGLAPSCRSGFMPRYRPSKAEQLRIGTYSPSYSLCFLPSGAKRVLLFGAASLRLRAPRYSHA
jgi:hypothetical protein